MYTKQKRT